MRHAVRINLDNTIALLRMSSFQSADNTACTWAASRSNSTMMLGVNCMSKSGNWSLPSWGLCRMCEMVNSERRATNLKQSLLVSSSPYPMLVANMWAVPGPFKKGAHAIGSTLMSFSTTSTRSRRFGGDGGGAVGAVGAVAEIPSALRSFSHPIGKTTAYPTHPVG